MQPGEGSKTRSRSTNASNLAPAATPPATSSGRKRNFAEADLPDDSRDAKRKKSRVDPRLQCAGYAVELLSCGGMRSHVISALVTRSKIELLYYDHGGAFVSQPLDFINEQAKFAAIIRALCNFTP